jgi:hypothetical protein
MDVATILAIARDAAGRAKAAQRAATNLVLPQDVDSVKGIETVAKSLYLDQKILDALTKIAKPLSNSYIQIAADFEDETRITWAGTAHEIRELLRRLLETLAPADKVEAEVWFKLEKGASGPTQKQRVKYIIGVRDGDSKQQKVAQDIELVEDKIGMLVRDVYGRASDAAHRSKNKSEAFKILRYFEAFAYDLLDIG